MEDVFGVGRVAEKIIDPVMDLLKKIAGPAADEIGLTLQDSVHVYRAKRGYHLAQKFQRFCEKHRIDPRPVPLKLLLPVLDAASVEDDDQIHTMWTNLLCSAAIPSSTPKPYPAFAEALKQLSKEEARFLNALHDDLEFRTERWHKLSDFSRVAQPFPYNNIGTGYQLIRLYLTINGFTDSQQLHIEQAPSDHEWTIDVAFENLARLGLIATNGGAYTIPAFGMMFAAVCRHPEAFVTGQPSSPKQSPFGS